MNMMKVSGMRTLMAMSRFRGDHPATAEAPRILAENDKQRIAAGGLGRPQHCGEDAEDEGVYY